MGVDFKTFRSVAPFVIDVRKPILIRGRHGVGKSEVVYQLAHDLGLPVVERRASQMTEGDLLGMPSTRIQLERLLSLHSFLAMCLNDAIHDAADPNPA